MAYTPQTPLVENRHAAGFIVSLSNGHQSIDGVTLAGGHGRLQAGSVIGFTSETFTATGAAVTGNTGNGTMSGLAATAPAVAGIYTISMISDTEFMVTNPNGEPVPALGGTVDPEGGTVVTGPGTVGIVFNSKGIGFLIAAGATAFIAGDGFTITVTDTGGGWAPVTASSSGITQYGLLYGGVDTTNGDTRATAVVRYAEVNMAELVWDTSLTAAQQNAAALGLKTQGVISR
ncbi:head decoration protein [Pseudomonas gingeri]|uniref:head decoration protein n=1 Tax=Pseudomonas gingeri TaxID=117681 RepID=UPI0015A0842F|nr:head decoration protein [Pseudomonas gingeri]NWA24050.1 head decoration protein [Pseudomonas gingeri]